MSILHRSIPERKVKVIYAGRAMSSPFDRLYSATPLFEAALRGMEGVSYVACNSLRGNLRSEIMDVDPSTALLLAFSCYSPNIPEEANSLRSFLAALSSSQIPYDLFIAFGGPGAVDYPVLILSQFGNLFVHDGLSPKGLIVSKGHHAHLRQLVELLTCAPDFESVGEKMVAAVPGTRFMGSDCRILEGPDSNSMSFPSTADMAGLKLNMRFLVDAYGQNGLEDGYVFLPVSVGCGRGCQMCQAGKIPGSFRPPTAIARDIIAIVEAGYLAYLAGPSAAPDQRRLLELVCDLGANNPGRYKSFFRIDHFLGEGTRGNRSPNSSLLDLVASSGCDYFEFGLESPDSGLNARLDKKRVTFEESLRVIVGALCTGSSVLVDAMLVDSVATPPEVLDGAAKLRTLAKAFEEYLLMDMRVQFTIALYPRTKQYDMFCYFLSQFSKQLKESGVEKSKLDGLISGLSDSCPAQSHFHWSVFALPSFFSMVFSNAFLMYVEDLIKEGVRDRDFPEITKQDLNDWIPHAFVLAVRAYERILAKYRSDDKRIRQESNSFSILVIARKLVQRGLASAEQVDDIDNYQGSQVILAKMIEYLSDDIKEYLGLDLDAKVLGAWLRAWDTTREKFVKPEDP